MYWRDIRELIVYALLAGLVYLLTVLLLLL